VVGGDRTRTRRLPPDGQCRRPNEFEATRPISKIVMTTSNSEISSSTTAQLLPSRNNWRLIVALSLAVLALLMQLFPKVVKTGLHYLDIRNWSLAARLYRYAQVFAEEHLVLTILFGILIVLGAICATLVCSRIQAYRPGFLQMVAEANEALIFCIALVVNSSVALTAMIVLLDRSTSANTHYLNPLNWSLPLRLAVNLVVVIIVVWVAIKSKKFMA
jgi:ABC-type spermidine/putrescine transport system permease subunit I